MDNISTRKNKLTTIHYYLLTALFLFPAHGEGRGILLANEADTLSVREMDEVVVVSTPKEHATLRDQTLSSSSFGEAQLVQRGIDNIKDLTAHVPGLFIPTYGSRLTSSIYLRGVGSRIGTPAVGMYVDDIPMANLSCMDQDLSDADRIDVLRGPQGTLFGRNTIGGLIRVYTKNPMNYQGTDLMLGGATYNNYRARVTHYHRPADNFAFSAGVGYEHLGGFYKNYALDEKRVDRSDDISARWRGIYVPSDKVRLDLSARYQWTKQGGYPYAAQQGPDAGLVAYNRESSYRRHLLSLGLNAEHDFGPVMMTSTTGFQFLKDDMFMDQDFSRQDLYSLQQKQKSKTLSEEIAVKSKGESRWQWTSGINFQYQWLNTEAPVTFYQEGVDWLTGIINRSLPDLTSKGMGQMSIALKNSEMPMGGVFDTPTLTAGIFHQSTIEIVKNLSLTAGVRLDYEHYKMAYDAPGNVDFDFAMPAHGMNVMLNNMNVKPTFLGRTTNHNWHVLPKASLKYDFGKVGNVYASVGRGYRSGGYNVQMFSDLLQVEMRREMMSAIDAGTEAYLTNLFARIPGMPAGHVDMIMGRIRSGMPMVQSPDVAATTYYKPETAWNYEIGSHLNLLDGRLQADLAAFWIETRNLQISQMAESGMGRVTINADRSRSIGMEASLLAYITDDFSLNTSYGYTRAKLRHTDCYVPFAPQHTLSLGARYVWHTRGWLQHIGLYMGGKGAGRIYWTRENDFSQPFYALLDARLSLTHDKLEFGIWGNNLTQTHYDAFSFVTRGQAFAQRGTPLQVGLDLRLKF
ncbi:MAG: TonB-dependent receptor [Bacteroidaceae bacterium]|nr:TonB-dependent receptor [Bacteroidaceae bacterium]